MKAESTDEREGRWFGAKPADKDSVTENSAKHLEESGQIGAEGESCSSVIVKRRFSLPPGVGLREERE
jgi:hypothetical protein